MATTSTERQTVLVLQGGGALGAYQAGVYQALHEGGIEPDWIIGTSIGAINASLIAGNPAPERLERLQEFWRRMAHRPPFGIPSWTGIPDTIAYWQTLFRGIPAFFEPNPGAFLGTHVPLGVDAAGFYSTAPLEKTLRDLVDFDAHQQRRAAAHGRRRACAHQHDEILRQPRHAGWRQARDGIRRAAAGVSGGADRRRALLGRRHPLQHADRGDLRRQSAQELADLRRAPVEPDGRRADLDLGGAQPAQGHPVFEPRREPHRAPAAAASHAPHHQRSRQAAAGRRPQLAQGARAHRLRLPDHHARRAPARAAARQREPHQGCRFQPGQHPHALGGGLREDHARARTGALGAGDSIRSTA